MKYIKPITKTFFKETLGSIASLVNFQAFREQELSYMNSSRDRKKYILPILLGQHKI